MFGSSENNNAPPQNSKVIHWENNPVMMCFIQKQIRMILCFAMCTPQKKMTLITFYFVTVFNATNYFS